MHLFSIVYSAQVAPPTTAWPLTSAPRTWAQVAAAVGTTAPAGIPSFAATAEWADVEAAATAYEQAHLTPWLQRLLQAASAGQLATTWDLGDAKDPLPRPLLEQYLTQTGQLPSGTGFTAAWLATQPLIAASAAEFTRLFNAGADVTAALPTYRHYAGMTLRELAWQMSIDIEDLELPEALAAQDQRALVQASQAFSQQYPGFTFRC